MPSGAFTGEVAAGMICRVWLHVCDRRAFGAAHAIQESDATVAAKAAAAIEAGLTPVVCVGETLAEREAGMTDAVVLRQLDAVLSRLGERIKQAVVAYEPVWAIGTGLNATPAEAQAVHKLLRKRLGTWRKGCVAPLRGQRQGG